MNKRLILLLLSLFLSFEAVSVSADDDEACQTGATNKDGSVVTNVLTASFDPFGQSSGRPVLPFPSNLAFFDTLDLTLETYPVDPNDYSDPKVALSALDGFSLVEKWVTGFASNLTGAYDNNTPGQIDPSSVKSGQSVRMFEVKTSQFLFVTSIVRELTPGVDYVAVPASASQIAILPLKPLKEYTAYMAVLTNDIRDTQGNDATPDRTYNFGKTSVPWVDSQGHSTNALFNDASAQQLELIRQVVQSMELNAAAYGIDPADIVLAWTAQTQSVTRTLKTLRALAQPAPTTIVPTGMTTHDVNPGWPGLASIHMGIITLPYYLDVPTAENPAAQLSTFWQAAPGAYVPPFDQFGLDPTSTNITIANPIPVKKSDQTVPIIVTVPSASSGHTKPAEGWPVVIWGHGITRNRLDALTVADTLASIGYATVAIDHPLHGVSPDAAPSQAPFWIENTPFADVANERTFDADFLNNVTLQLGPDGLIDPPGWISIPAALQNMLGGRDTFRQGIIDLSQVAVSISSMDIDLDGQPDLNANNMAYAGESWGAMYGMGFVAIEPLITRAALFWPGGNTARFAVASPTYGPMINGILAQAGVQPGTADYEQFLLVWQTTFDASDPVNWSIAAATNTPIMLSEVINDQNIPNYVPTAPLAGTEPLIKIMGLTAYSTSQVNMDGLRAAGRYVPPAEHAQILSPTFGSPAAYFEMQRQLASFIASHGGSIVVTDESTMVPEAQMVSQAIANLTEKKLVSGKTKQGIATGNRTQSRLLRVKQSEQPGNFE